MATGAERERPLVSCIMPTHDRRPFVGRAIEHFLRQDYPHRELIIVDDGADAVRDLVPDLGSETPRIRYLRLESRRTLGAKRNLAGREAQGEVIVHWDDDDWMAPGGSPIRSLSCSAARRTCAGSTVSFSGNLAPTGRGSTPGRRARAPGPPAAPSATREPSGSAIRSRT